MKKLFLCILVTSVGFCAYAQDITNQTGSNGSFLVKNSNDEVEMKLSSNVAGEASVHIGKTDHDVSTIGANIWMLDIQSSTISPHISFSAFSNNTFGPNLWFHKARGATTTITSGDELGTISFYGHDGAGWEKAAYIFAECTSVGTAVGGRIKFYTTNSGGTETKALELGDDGTATFTSLTGTYLNNQAYVVVNDAGELSAQDDPPSLAPLYEEIQKLKEENEILRAQLAELTQMLESLIHE